MSDQMEQSAEQQNSGEVEQDQPDPILDDDLDSGAEGDESEQNEEEEELEIAGKKLAIPKSVAEALKSERMMQADYTRKTQEVAEQRKAVEAEQQQIRQQAKEQQQFIQEYAKVVAIDDQLAQYRALDWQQIINADPVQAMQLQQAQKALEFQRHQAVEAVTQKQQQEAMNKQQSIAKQVQEAEAYFAREIPGWSPERSTQLQQYAKSQGVNEQALAKAILRDPSIVKALDKAEKWDRLAEKQIAKPKPAVQSAPVTRIRATGASASKDPDKMSTDEWLKWRETDLAAKRKR